MSDGTKDLLKTVFAIALVIAVCFFAFKFVIKGGIELAQEYKSFSGASVFASSDIKNTYQNSNKVFGVTEENNNSTSNQNSNSSSEGSLPQRPPSQWMRYTSPSYHFSVMFPENPKIETYTNSEGTLYSHTSSLGQDVFEVDLISSRNPQQTFSEEELYQFVEGLATSQRKKIETISYDSKESVVYFALIDEISNISSKGLVIPVDDFNLYVLEYQCHLTNCDENRYHNFISSFKILE